MTGPDTSADEREAGAVLSVDLEAVARNYRRLAALSGTAVCAAVVKADAYGLGAARVVPALAQAGASVFFTAQWSEARDLPRDAACVYALNGLAPGTEAKAARETDGGRLAPVLNSFEQAQAWAEAAPRGERLPAALHLDTGLSRLGLSPEEGERLLSAPVVLEKLDLRLVVSHLACAEEPEHPANARQLARFAARLARFPGVAGSLANSAGIFLGEAYRFGLVRAGAALYGINPRPGGPNPMEPALRLQARVVQERRLAAGDRVGYGETFTAPRPMRAVTVGLGYGDGWPRAARLGAFHNGQRLPVLGRVSMDTTVLDASAVAPDALGPGALVDFLCAQQTADDVAAATGTIGYEILTGLGRRPVRRYL